jgi:hypothetical protein
MKLRWMGFVSSACLAMAASASATMLTVDGAYGPTAGSSDCTFACVVRYQQVFDNVLFGPSPVDITSIEFLSNYAFSQSWGSGNAYTLTIGIASTGVDALSSSFDANFQSSQPFETTSFSGTQALGSFFGFTGSYVYYPSLGDLLIDITRVAGAAGGPFVEYTANSGGEFSRVYDFDSTIAGFTGSEYGDTTRFGLLAVVPEPPMLALLVFGIMGIGFARRRAHGGRPI